MDSENFNNLLISIRDRVSASDCFSPDASETELIKLCNDVGRLVYENIKDDTDAERIMDDICHELPKHYPGQEGFQVSITVLMKEFYLEFQKNDSLSTLVEELHWEQNLILIQSFADLNEREFYMRMSTNFDWSLEQLKAHIEHETYLKSNAKAVFSDSSAVNENKQQWIAEDINLKEFSVLSAEDLQAKRNIIENIIANLVEPFSPYALIGKKCLISDSSFNCSIDLLLFNRALNSILVFEIKSEKYKPLFSDIMHSYLSLVNSKVKLKHEKPAIGVILSIEDQDIQAHYAIAAPTDPEDNLNYTITEGLTEDYFETLPSLSDFETMIHQ